MTYTSNPQLEQAFDYVQNTHQNIFLTGKAGTGKTTFLHRVKKECIKRLAVVAPTGIAAINAKGMTIHSLFQLSFGLHLPNQKKQISRFSKKKIKLIKSLDLLIIDEISMVRADVLDQIDNVLKRFKDYRQPFGGVQLLMIGDLHQLPPVVKNEDWKLLKRHYKSPYFFDSNAWKKTNPITIQLTHIYRQSDDVFIKLLNKVRDNQLDKAVLDTLNSRYKANFQPKETEGYITLTALNRTAQAINNEKLKALSNPEHHFKAKITGEFPEHAFPTKEILAFKVGAQVLFIKNDRSPEKRYFNGKIGRITAIEKDHVYIKCPNEEETIKVSPTEWKNVKYELDETTKEITEEEKGVFIQYPLKLAWAITIHKSQGLTFEKAIIDAQAAFAHGQVYVALSRCKSFEGIVLRSPINYGSVKTDGLVKDYSAEAAKNAPDETHLLTAKKQYQQDLIEELFNFRDLRFTLNDLLEISLAYQPKFNTPLFPKVADWETQADTLLFSMAAKFAPKLRNYFTEPMLPVANEVLMERLKKAGQYFSDNLKGNLVPALQNIPILADNQEVKHKAVSTLDLLKKQVFIKAYCFKALTENGFDAQQYLKNKAIAATDFEKTKQVKKPKVNLTIPEEVPHPELYKQLYYWRNTQAATLKRQTHEVISTMSMIDMTKKLPTNKTTLLKVKGFGLVKFKVFGQLIMEVIDDYCYQHQLAANILEESPNLAAKTDIPATTITEQSTKAYSVESIREKHPKAYAPWTEAEEKELVQLKASEKSISYIAGVLGRKRGAITARLKKLDGGTEQGMVVFS